MSDQEIHDAMLELTMRVDELIPLDPRAQQLTTMVRSSGYRILFVAIQSDDENDKIESRYNEETTPQPTAESVQ